MSIAYLTCCTERFVKIVGEIHKIKMNQYQSFLSSYLHLWEYIYYKMQGGDVSWIILYQRWPRSCFTVIFAHSLSSWVNSLKLNAPLCPNFWTHFAISTSLTFTPISCKINFNLSRETRPSSPGENFLKILPASSALFWTKTTFFRTKKKTFAWAILLLPHQYSMWVEKSQFHWHIWTLLSHQELLTLTQFTATLWYYCPELFDISYSSSLGVIVKSALSIHLSVSHSFQIPHKQISFN